MKPDQSKADAYLTTKVLTASPEELRLMLIDGAIKFSQQGRDALARKDFEGCYNGYTRARAILVELTNTMRPEPDRKLYERLTSLYMFLFRRLLESSHEKDIAKADEVITLLKFERETWVMLMEKLASERRGQTPPAQPGTDATPSLTSSLSLAG
ncbi:MAG: flagellar export chaperone FliS [Phycisphaerales bacterium]|jgi:flagellar protein FliS|nr:flagellar export chaperone FliS [Phycisphaeraceae bacterium]